MEKGSELVELTLVMPTQTEKGSELIELKLIMPTQMGIGFKLIEIILITPYKKKKPSKIENFGGFFFISAASSPVH